MNNQASTKTVGFRKNATPSPEECHKKANRMIQQMNRLNPYPAPRGFVFKSRTWKEYEAWRAKQENPRLW